MKTYLKQRFGLILLPFLVLLPGLAGAAGVHHEIKATLDPGNAVISVSDTIKLAGRAHNSVIFELHQALDVSSEDDNVISLQAVQESSTISLGGQGTAIYYRYLVKLKDTNKPFTLSYKGSIEPTVADSNKVIETTGVINNDGVFLARSSRWYPVFSQAELLTFNMSVTLPKGWQTVSQGKLAIGKTVEKGKSADNTVTFIWQETNPQDDIFLIAAKFNAFQQQYGKVKALVYLRDNDQKLAQKYLDATGQYVEMYSRLLGDYPYEKFAMVENFWETGYGMPSFTLLGSKVLRFPFILYTSYPHEILHNWWGNSVYVDYDSGNWAEGLTAYLADHLMKEQRGQARLYRRGILQKYTDYVNEADDFPLREFRSRHNAESAAIGYGKTAMMFHMLRLEFGEEVFVRSMRQLYKDHRYKSTRFSDIQAIFSEQSGRDLKPFFYQWTQRKGAPQLSVLASSVIHNNKGYELSMTLAQTQHGQSFRLYVPVSISLENSDTAFKTAVILTDQEQTFTLPLASRPLRIDVDPGFDVFRRLEVSEIPSALSQGYGADRPLLILPSKAKQELLLAYKKMLQQWKRSQNEQMEIILDSDIKQLPIDRTVWLLGWENRFRDVLSQAKNAQIEKVAPRSLMIGGQEFTRGKHSIVITARQPQNSQYSILWMATDNLAAIPGLTRKLPHYGKYSYLAFEGDEPSNIAKGQWQLGDSPMAKKLDKKANKPPKWIARAPLINLPPVFSKQRMMKDIQYLASKERKGRELASEGLSQAADYIAAEFKKAGLQPGGDKGESYFQTWRQDLGKPKGDVSLKNVVAVLPGTNPSLQKQSIIISAHYDHLGLGWPDVHAGDVGKIHPGANDNASGVAVMLELARQIAKKWRPERAIVFIAFTGEEAALMGSDYYMRHASQYPAKQVFTVLNLDTVGRLDNNPLSIMGVGTASELTHVFRGIGYVTGLKLNPIANDIGASDQKRFIDIGVPGVQFFTKVQPYLHRPEDTIDKIDADGLLKVAMVVKEAAEYLANRVEALHVTINNAALAKFDTTPTKQPRTSRRVRLGTIPDYSYQGKGVRIDAVSDDSPAASAGLKAGDIVLKINDIKIANLSAMSKALGRLSAGDQITLAYQRAGKAQAVTFKVDKR